MPAAMFQESKMAYLVLNVHVRGLSENFAMDYSCSSAAAQDELQKEYIVNCLTCLVFIIQLTDTS
jgi:hypothetical protein